MSVLLFRLVGFFMFLIISTFSVRHSWHVFIPGLYFGHLFLSSHLTEGAGLALFSQMWADNVVLFFFFSSLKEWLWLLYLVLKALSVTPIYSAWLPLGQSRTALYTTLSSRHLFSTGQLSLFLQLQSFFSVVVLILFGGVPLHYVFSISDPCFPYKNTKSWLCVGLWFCVMGGF